MAALDLMNQAVSLVHRRLDEIQADRRKLKAHSARARLMTYTLRMADGRPIDRTLVPVDAVRLDTLSFIWRYIRGVTVPALVMRTYRPERVPGGIRFGLTSFYDLFTDEADHNIPRGRLASAQSAMLLHEAACDYEQRDLKSAFDLPVPLVALDFQDASRVGDVEGSRVLGANTLVPMDALPPDLRSESRRLQHYFDFAPYLGRSLRNPAWFTYQNLGLVGDAPTWRTWRRRLSDRSGRFPDPNDDTQAAGQAINALAEYFGRHPGSEQTARLDIAARAMAMGMAIPGDRDGDNQITELLTRPWEGVYGEQFTRIDVVELPREANVDGELVSLHDNAVTLDLMASDRAGWFRPVPWTTVYRTDDRGLNRVDQRSAASPKPLRV